ncbi:MAG: hypothetical protein ACLVD4_03955 [Negativibacillus sp.]
MADPIHNKTAAGNACPNHQREAPGDFDTRTQLLSLVVWFENMKNNQIKRQLQKI